MIAEIFSVGTELLLGQIANTDAQYLSAQLPLLGINVYRHTVVGDNPGRLKQAFEETLSRADIIITTGGLGPTQDDLTKQTISDYLGLPLERDEGTVENLKAFFSSINKPMTENNLRQADFPVGCDILRNDAGTAPGCAIRWQDKLIIILPGPPRELKWMYENVVKDYLSAYTGVTLYSRVLRFYGIGESELEDKLMDLILEQTNPTIAPYAQTGEVTLRITAAAKDQTQADELIDAMKARVCERVGEFFYTDQYTSLAETVVKTMIEQKTTVATAESCTGGMLAAQIVDISGASEIYMGGAVTYANEMKMKLLGVREETLKEHGAVSEECAREMAQGALKLVGTDYALATTGIAGPTGGTPDKPVGTVYIALAQKDGETVVRRYRFSRDRSYVRSGTCLAAFDLLRKNLKK